MMRIKEAIQRRKLIQQLNDEYAAIEDDSFAQCQTNVLQFSSACSVKENLNQCGIVKLLNVPRKILSKAIHCFKELGHEATVMEDVNISANRQIIRKRNPRVSMLKIVYEIGMNWESVRQLAKKELGLRPYKLQNFNSLRTRTSGKDATNSSSKPNIAAGKRSFSRTRSCLRLNKRTTAKALNPFASIRIAAFQSQNRKSSVSDVHGYGGNGRSALLASALRRNAAAAAAAAVSGDCCPNSPSAFRDADASSMAESEALSVSVDVNDEQRAYSNLQTFVAELNQRLNDGHRRALRVTWKRLSEPPKTSGRGTLQIMEKVFEQIFSGRPETMSIFYRSAFLKCIDDRRYGRSSGTIATVRDHAHFFIDLIDAIMCVMFDTPLRKPVWDPATIGRAHAKYASLGFDAQIWHKLGECFAEVMFSQECVRAYPLAASAWSMLSVAITDKMYSHSCRTNRNVDVSLGTMRPTTSINASLHDLRPMCPQFQGHQSHRPHYPQSYSAPGQNSLPSLPTSPPQRQQSSSSGSVVGAATPQRQFSSPKRSMPPQPSLPAFERINGWPHHPQQLQYHHHHHSHHHQHHQHNNYRKSVRQSRMTIPQQREETGQSGKEEKAIPFVRAPPLAKCRSKENVTTAVVGESDQWTEHK